MTLCVLQRDSCSCVLHSVNAETLYHAALAFRSTLIRRPQGKHFRFPRSVDDLGASCFISILGLTHKVLPKSVFSACVQTCQLSLCVLVSFILILSKQTHILVSMIFYDELNRRRQAKGFSCGSLELTCQLHSSLLAQACRSWSPTSSNLMRAK